MSFPSSTQPLVLVHFCISDHDQSEGIGEFQVILPHGLKPSPGWLLGPSLQNPGKGESEVSLLQRPLQT